MNQSTKMSASSTDLKNLPLPITSDELDIACYHIRQTMSSYVSAFKSVIKHNEAVEKVRLDASKAKSLLEIAEANVSFAKEKVRLALDDCKDSSNRVSMLSLMQQSILAANTKIINEFKEAKENKNVVNSDYAQIVSNCAWQKIRKSQEEFGKALTDDDCCSKKHHKENEHLKKAIETAFNAEKKYVDLVVMELCLNRLVDDNKKIANQACLEFNKSAIHSNTIARNVQSYHNNQNSSISQSPNQDEIDSNMIDSKDSMID